MHFLPLWIYLQLETTPEGVVAAASAASSAAAAAAGGAAPVVATALAAVFLWRWRRVAAAAAVVVVVVAFEGAGDAGISLPMPRALTLAKLMTGAMLSRRLGVVLGFGRAVAAAVEVWVLWRYFASVVRSDYIEWTRRQLQRQQQQTKKES